MKITIGMIEKLNPCESRFDNFKNHYPSYEGDFRDFLALENITYNDKVWVASRILNRNQLVHWSIFCAESVKPIFENKYTNNKCLTILLDYLKSIPDFNNLSQEIKDKIWELRRPAAAAAYAADAAYAAYAAAAYAAADADADAAAAAADAAREEQRNLNLLFLASLIED